MKKIVLGIEGMHCEGCVKRLTNVLSELDSSRKTKFIEFLKKFNQVFITSTNKINDLNLTYYLVNDEGVSIK